MPEDEIRGDDHSSEDAALHDQIRQLQEDLGNRSDLLAFLAEAGRILSESLDYHSTLRRVARLALPYFGGWSIVDLRADGDEMERAAIINPDSELQKFARQLEGGWPPARDDPIGLPAVFNTGESILLPRLDDDERAELASEENLEIIEKLGIRSVITVPLTVRDRVMGAMTFISGEDEHVFGENDLRLAEELAGRCAMALDNALLYEEAQGKAEAEAGRKQVADILDRSLDGFIAFDRQWHFTYANERAEDALETPFASLDGRSLEDAFPDLWQSHLMDEARRAMREMRTVEAEEFAEERGRWFHVVCYPAEDGITIQFRDVTERKRTESELARAEEHYHRLVETSPYGIFVLDEQGCFVDINSAMRDILEVSDQSIYEQNLSVLVPEDERMRASRFVVGVRSGSEDGMEVELHLVRPSGERRLCSITGTAVRDADAIAGVYGVARDVTDEREREAHLRRAERLASLGTLLSGVAHELDNPLTSIRGFAELLLMEEQTESTREGLAVIQREADRTSKIVSDLRLLARHTQEEPRGDRMPVDLNDIVRHVHRIRKYSLDTHNIRVELSLEEDLPEVLADRGQMEQVLLNLVVNAEQALEDVPQERRLVRMVTRSQGDQVFLEVEDTGTGISRDSIEKVFDPFWSTRQAGGGSGLGLSLVHNMVSEHGGRVSVQSEVEEGSTFTVVLPRMIEERPPAPEPREAAPRPGASRTLRVLVVDDEESIRRLLVLYLERQGHRAEEAAEGGEALQLVERAAEEGGFDVVLTDLRMPGMSGAQFFEELRDRDESYARRVVFMTGEAASGDAARILAATGAPVLFKPVTLKELLHVLEDRARAVSMQS